MPILQKDSQAWSVPSTGIPPDTSIDVEVTPSGPAIEFLKEFFGLPLRTLIFYQEVSITKREVEPIIVVVRRVWI
jgi:hypothetical protein